MRPVPPDVRAAMEQCLDDCEEQLRTRPSAELERDHDLGWTFHDELRDWSVSVVLDGDVERIDGRLRVPLLGQARKGRGLRGHKDDTVRRMVLLDCQ